MAIRIEHRFLHRLFPDKQIVDIQYLIIGTFNPAAPAWDLLTPLERAEFAVIENTMSYRRLLEVKNFYDRPQNRFWKIMDTVCNPSIYRAGDYKKRNLTGLKFYMNTSMTRKQVFERQQAFCNSKRIFITDLVREIRPVSFKNIYSGFPDKGIDRAVSRWNTSGIKKVIERCKPRKILINLKSNEKSLPNISSQIEELKEEFGSRVIHVSSTSGNAGYTYAELVNHWIQHF